MLQHANASWKVGAEAGSKCCCKRCCGWKNVCPSLGFEKFFFLLADRSKLSWFHHCGLVVVVDAAALHLFVVFIDGFQVFFFFAWPKKAATVFCAAATLAIHLTMVLFDLLSVAAAAKKQKMPMLLFSQKEACERQTWGSKLRGALWQKLFVFFSCWFFIFLFTTLRAG